MKTLLCLILCLFILTSCTNKNEKEYTVTNVASLENPISTKSIEEDDVKVSFTYEVKEQENEFAHIYKIKVNEDFVENGKDLFIVISQSTTVLGKFDAVVVDNETYFAGKFIIQYDGFREEFDRCESSQSNNPSLLFSVPDKCRNLEVYAEFTMYYEKFYVSSYQSVKYTHYNL